MANDKKINSGTEFITERGQVVLNSKSGAVVFDETTGQEKVHITHQSGANINLNNKVFSEFAPNNKQSLTHGDSYITVGNNSFTTTNASKEDRTKGDLTIITGPDSFFDSTVASDWLNIFSEIAAAKAAPEYTYKGIGNNSNAVYEEDGSPNPDSGAVEGGSYKENPAHADIPGLMEEKAGELATVESQMGVGGNIKLMSAKNILFQAGTKATTYDSGIMVPNGKSVTQKYTVEDNKLVETKTATSVYENKDTSNTIPFGDIHIAAGTKLNMSTGSGGMNMNSAGEVNLNSTGRLMLGGSEVSIGGGDQNDVGRVTIKSDKDVFVKSGDLLAQVSTHRTDTTYNQHTIDTPHALFTGDLEVYGDLIVHGNITVCGSTGIRVPNGDVKAGSVSLKDHTHGGVEPGGGKTDPP